jgi:hypothetical protein
MSSIVTLIESSQLKSVAVSPTTAFDFYENSSLRSRIDRESLLSDREITMATFAATIDDRI